MISSICRLASSISGGDPVINTNLSSCLSSVALNEN